jgi:hypothetical protein
LITLATGFRFFTGRFFGARLLRCSRDLAAMILSTPCRL